jgi:hypothetical protein
MSDNSFEDDLDVNELLEGLTPAQKLELVKAGFDTMKAQRASIAQPDVEAINARAAQIARDKGVELTQDDPEFDAIRWRTKDPQNFLSDFERAAESKRERTTQARLMPQYQAEIAAAQYKEQKLQIRAKYRARGLKI